MYVGSYSDSGGIAPPINVSVDGGEW
jgi:hypothetical protein